jgi:histidyl-tRNA synthetase
MTEKKRIYKPTPISGFPEWLPEERLVEQKWFDHIRRVFESYGFCSIETPSVEALDAITAKGEVDKEIYIIDRLHKEDGDKEARLALHFDQTVPLARYVAQHFSDLVFPFKRYQMQRVWRGERPQMGRMREFYQCDIDIIHVDNLPLSFDAEVASVMYEVLDGLKIGKAQLRISNRKIILGFLEEWGVPDPTALIRILDKIEKVGEAQTFSDLSTASSHTSWGQDLNVPNMLIGLSKIKASTSTDLRNQLNALKMGPMGEKHLEGVEELCFVLDNLSHLPDHAVVADLSIVRGLDYYTGTVYETQLLDVPEFTGSVCSGGRYDDLAGSFINKHLPGVGISIGFSRLFDVMRQSRPDLLGIGPKSPAHIMMVLPSEDKRALTHETARTLRNRGYNVEVYHAPQKIGKQMEYASKKLIPYVWFPPFEDGKPHEVKNMTTGEQSTADPDNWSI